MTDLKRDSSGPRVLLVDDDPAVLQTLGLMFEMLGIAAHVAHNGQQGLDAFCQASKGLQPYDIVFTDLGMPGLDGLALAEKIKRLRLGTRVVLLSGWNDDPDSLAAMQAGILDRIMRKPPRLADLREVLQHGYPAA